MPPPKRLKILAISDTHLGEDTSLLSFPHGRQHLWKILRPPFGSEEWGKEKLEVDEMILLGDIPDRTLSSSSQIITHTNAFIQMLGSAVNIRERGVYVPGNHDHTLWTDYRKLRYGEDNLYGITERAAGDPVVQQGQRCDQNGSASELLSIFFGYPAGSAWRKIQEEGKFNFAIANPLYATQINERTYVFTHGTHFKKIVTLPAWIKKFFDILELDKLLGNIELETEKCDVNKAKCLGLEKLEQVVAPFVDSLWPSSKNNPTSQSDQLWYLLTTVSGKLESKRPYPCRSKLFSSCQLESGNVPETRIRQLTADDRPTDDSIEMWKTYFLPPMLRYLCKNSLPQDKVTFVYGDTHDGGWGEFPLDSGGRIRIYNCGGWVVHNDKDHPACHLFAVDESGDEYLLDVSYKDVRVGGDSLLELAARDFENRSRNTSRILRAFLKLWEDRGGVDAPDPLESLFEP